MWLVIQTQTLLVVLILTNQHLYSDSNFIYGLKMVDTISRTLRIFYDNSVIVYVAKNNKSESWSKHIDIKYLVIRERVKYKKMVIENISMELMITDPLTKGMPPFKFKDRVERMRLGSNLWLYTYRLELKLLYCDIFSYSCAHWFIWEKQCFGPRINIRFIH